MEMLEHDLISLSSRLIVCFTQLFWVSCNKCIFPRTLLDHDTTLQHSLLSYIGPGFNRERKLLTMPSIKGGRSLLCPSVMLEANSLAVNATLPRSAETPIENTQWSKEALFGLLGVVLLIVVPLYGYALQDVVRNILCTKTQEKPKSRYVETQISLEILLLPTKH